MFYLDVAIIGGSFAGVSAGMSVARAGKKVTIFDNGKHRNRFSPEVHGLFGLDGKSPDQLKQEGQINFSKYPTASIENLEVLSISQKKNEFELKTTEDLSFIASRIILAHGVTDILPEIRGAKEIWGKTLLHCPYCHGFEFKGKKLGVLYSGEQTLRKLRLLQDWSSEILLLLNGNQLSEEDNEEIKQFGIQTNNDIIDSFKHWDRRLLGVRFKNGNFLDCDAIYTVTKHTLNNSFAEQLGCEIVEGSFGPIIKVNEYQQTSNPHVFAAGDCARNNHNANLANSDGAAAGAYAHQSLLSEE